MWKLLNVTLGLKDTDHEQYSFLVSISNNNVNFVHIDLSHIVKSQMLNYLEKSKFIVTLAEKEEQIDEEQESINSSANNSKSLFSQSQQQAQFKQQVRRPLSRIEEISSILPSSQSPRILSPVLDYSRNFLKNEEDPRLDTVDQMSTEFLIDVEREAPSVNLEKSPHVYQEYNMLELINEYLLRSRSSFDNMRDFQTRFVDKLNKMERRDITVMKSDKGESNTLVERVHKDYKREKEIYVAVWKPGYKNIVVRCKKKNCLFTLRFSYQLSVINMPTAIKFLHVGTLSHRFPAH